MRQDLFEVLINTLINANVRHGADTMDAVYMLGNEYPDQFKIFNDKLPNAEDIKCNISSEELQEIVDHVKEHLLKIIEPELEEK